MRIYSYVAEIRVLAENIGEAATARDEIGAMFAHSGDLIIAIDNEPTDVTDAETGETVAE